MVKAHRIVFILIALAITLFGMIGSFILPEHFMFDAKVIVLDQYNERGWFGSYPFAMMFYHLTKLRFLNYPLIALIQLPIVFYMLSRLGIPSSFYKWNLRNVTLWLGLTIFGVFVGIPSKEFITAIVVFIVCTVIISKISLTRKILFTSVIFMIIGAMFRQYFMLVPIIAIALYGIGFIKFKNRSLSIILGGLLVISMISLSHGIIKGKFITDNFRQTFNKHRIATGNKHSNTMILSPVASDHFAGEVFGIVYGFVSVNIPVAGFKFLKPHIIAFVIWQLSLFALLCYYYNRVLSKKKQYKHEQWVFHLLFAYFIVQGIFEPDLGSAVKHKLGVFPLIWLAIYYDKNLIKRPAIIKKYVFKKTTQS